MHELPLLINITLALVVAFLGGLVARKVGLPLMNFVDLSNSLTIIIK